MIEPNTEFLPRRGWHIVSLSDLVKINPTNPEDIPNDELEVSFIPMASVEAISGRLDPSGKRLWGEVKKGYKRFQEGDILFAKITPCMENGKVALATDLENGVGAGSTEFHVLRPHEVAVPKFVMYYILQEDFRKAARLEMTGTAGHLRVPQLFLEEHSLLLPPLPEQHRIVEAIESYLSRLDDAVATLERVQANLKRYRASVLKAAVEGRLVPTEAELAKAEGRDYEPASALLERILADRRRRWEEDAWAKEVEKAKQKAAKAARKAEGHPWKKGDSFEPGEWEKIEEAQYARYLPKNDKWKENYKEPETPDTSELPDLPEGWLWTTAISACKYVVDCHNKTPPYVEEGIPLLRTPNIRDGKLIWDKLRFVDFDTYMYWSRRCIPEPRDVLFTREAPMGEVAIIPDGMTICMGQRMMLLRADPVYFLPEYLCFLLQAPNILAYATRRAVGTGVKHLRVADVERIPVPLPPRDEQKRIVDEVGRLLSVHSEVESTVQKNILRCKRLKQAVLKWAFEGKLADQDPNDEPASVLLERIQEEREALEGKKKVNKKKQSQKRKRTKKATQQEG